MDRQLRQILKKYWGYDDFRPGQIEIIRSIVAGDEVLALLTTGGGKSICFQVAGLALSGLTVVVSPLISLMQDQVQRLQSLGIAAAAYNSTLAAHDREMILEKVFKGELQFLYLAPETLTQPKIIDCLLRADVRLLSIDEAHCISIWGQDFRPAYMNIVQFLDICRSKDRSIVVAAFTATATQEVKSDICKQLKFTRPRIFQNSFVRENLSLKVVKSMTSAELISLTHKKLSAGAVLVYAASRERTKTLAEVYKAAGIDAVYYHAGLPANTRERIQRDYIADKVAVVVATNAFGMGVDKPNINTVIHEQISDSIENYYQEAGRAGRGGQASESIVNFSWKGVNLRNQMLENSYVTPAQANEFYNYLLKLYKKHKREVLNFSEQEALLDLKGINKPKLNNLLTEFCNSGIISYNEGEFEVLKPNILFLSRHIDFGKHRRQFKRSRLKLTSLIDVYTTKSCRMQAIMAYFSEKSSACGNCDNCLNNGLAG